MSGLSVVQAIAAVMEDVQAVRKADRNAAQNFNFRGIDAVVNAVGPALRRHGVVALPTLVEPTFESYQSRQGAQMRNSTLKVTFRFYGPAGDFIEAQTMGEAADAGDKSVTKAHSVAYRTLLLQALCIPTDEPDPDSAAHERAVPDERGVVRSLIAAAGNGRGWNLEDTASDFASWSGGRTIREADADLLQKYLDHLRDAS